MSLIQRLKGFLCVGIRHWHQAAIFDALRIRFSWTLRFFKVFPQVPHISHIYVWIHPENTRILRKTHTGFLWAEWIELKKTSVSVDGVADRCLWLSDYITNRWGFWLHELCFWLQLWFGLRALHPAEFFIQNSLSSFSAARWLRMLLRASECRRKTCRLRTAKEARFHAKQSKWQPCCYSTFQCDVISTLHSMFLSSLRNWTTSNSLLSRVKTSLSIIIINVNCGPL